jgi:hypothetical protein
MNRAFSNTRNFTRHCPAVLVITLASLCLAVTGESEPIAPVAPVYHIYAGNTHSHTSYTWSHGTQWPAKPESRMVVRDSTSYPGPDAVPKPDWKKYQGPPAEHFALAKAQGYDFYVVTDHSQESPLQPVSPTNPAWVDTAKAAAAITDSHFLALRGFENSENNGPGGKGHLNVINSEEYLNALSPGIDLPYLYRWLKTARPDGAGPVVASFNHPGPHQYNDWAHRDPQITDIITMLEVINSNNKIHYDAFLNALDKGWKVSPICGNDNHGTGGITQHTSRTFVLATSLTKAALLEALQHRRTYAALDGNIQCRYSVNGAIMGSTLDRPDVFHFAITIRDPDTARPGDRITKIDIVKDGGQVVETYRPAPAHSVTWDPTIKDATSHYFFVRVWNERGGDAAGGDPNEPIAWLAPVWTGR